MNRARLFAFLLALGATAGLAYWLFHRERVLTPPPETEQHRQIRKSVLHNVSSELVAEVLQLEAQEKHIAETVWAKEMLAQEYGRAIEKLWDEINAASNKLDVVANFPIEEIQLGDWKKPEEKPHGIQIFVPSEPGPVLSNTGWRELIGRFKSDGWILDQIEFRHNRFDVTSSGGPSHSRFYFSAHLLNRARDDRASLEGDLGVHWGAKTDDATYEIRKIDAKRLTIKIRHGDPPFRLVLNDEIVPQGQSKLIDPLILYDLNGDGLSEIILAGRNLVYRNRGDFQFSPEPLCRFPEEFISTALIADFDGDGHADFLCAKSEGLFVFRGSTAGTFGQKAASVWKPERPLEKPMVMTCGDIDADDDLDIFLGQYKDPYEGGVTPKPFYDANDGYPAYLLVNNGSAQFEDKTAASDLLSKRSRRIFSASFVDLDRDYDLDLLVVSDFAGADIYQNDATGKFTDVTGSWLREPQAFGMAHSLADFNNDGLLDILMIGMTSPTLQRLDHLNLTRSSVPEERTMEQRMTFGNRLYFGKHSGGFEQTSMSDVIARSGWAWGCSSFDFDNDGFIDVYIGNGFQSQRTVTDSEGDYWLHDRFLESTPAADLYFKSSGARSRGMVRSFGGHERNPFYWNQGTNFFNIAYLLGLSLTEDSRNVLSDDLDRDGRIDVVLTTSELWPQAKQTLKVFENHCKTVGNWIGLSAESPPQHGFTIGIEAGRNRAAVYATGQGFRSQPSASIHFGLGQKKQVEKLRLPKIRQTSQQIETPPINKYLALPGPKATSEKRKRRF